MAGGNPLCQNQYLSGCLSVLFQKPSQDQRPIRLILQLPIAQAQLSEKTWFWNRAKSHWLPGLLAAKQTRASPESGDFGEPFGLLGSCCPENPVVSMLVRSRLLLWRDQTQIGYLSSPPPGQKPTKTT